MIGGGKGGVRSVKYDIYMLSYFLDIPSPVLIHKLQ